MPVTRANRKTEPPITIGGSIKIAHRVDDVIESTHQSFRYNQINCAPRLSFVRRAS
jgi:hypothetical protein